MEGKELRKLLLQDEKFVLVGVENKYLQYRVESIGVTDFKGDVEMLPYPEFERKFENLVAEKWVGWQKTTQ